MRFPIRATAVVWFALVGAVAVIAQPPGAAAATKAEQEALLKRIIASPADYEAVYTYVKVSKELTTRPPSARWNGCCSSIRTCRG